MKHAFVVPLAMICGCGAGPASLERWDDPDVIQIVFPVSPTAPFYDVTRPAPFGSLEEAINKPGVPPITMFRWYDARIAVDEAAEGWAVTARGPGDWFRLSGPTPEPGVEELQMASTAADFSVTAAALALHYQPHGVAVANMCIALNVDQSLTVAEVFAVHNAFKGLGLTCILLEQELAQV